MPKRFHPHPALPFQKHENIKLVFDGEGPREELVALSKRLGVESKLLFMHSCSDEELAEVYAACDVFVFPAQITWGLAVVEAMAASKPVVVSSNSGASEIIRNGENGFVVEEPNAGNMALQIERLILDNELRRKIGANAYEFTKKILFGKFTRKIWRQFSSKQSIILVKDLISLCSTNLLFKFQDFWSDVVACK